MKKITSFILCFFLLGMFIFAQSKIVAPSFCGVTLGDSKSQIASTLNKKGFYTQNNEVFMNVGLNAGDYKFDGYLISVIAMNYDGEKSFGLSLGFDQNIKFENLKKSLSSYLAKNYKKIEKRQSTSPLTEPWIVDDAYFVAVTTDGSKSFIYFYDMDYVTVD